MILPILKSRSDFGVHSSSSWRRLLPNRGALPPANATLQSNQQSLQALLSEKGLVVQRFQTLKAAYEAKEAELRQLAGRCRGLHSEWHARARKSC